MYPSQFDYTVADSPAHAVYLLSRHGDGTKLLAGGQSLVPLLKLRLVRPTRIFDIARVPDFLYPVQSDITIASEDARFAFPEINPGFPPTVVIACLSRWIYRKKAFELVVTRDELNADEAERQGLVNLVVGADRLEAEKDALGCETARSRLARATCGQMVLPRYGGVEDSRCCAIGSDSAGQLFIEPGRN